MIQTKDIKKEINYYKDCLKSISSEIKRLKKMVPEGARLRAAKHGEKYQYFIRMHDNGTNGTYINKKNRNTAVILAQIEYDEKLKTILQDVLDYYNRWPVEQLDNPFIFALDQMIPGKRELVSVPFETDDYYLTKWITQTYTRLEFKDDYPEYYTRKGLRVRSKSEILIADILDELSIPFLYEKPLQLNTGTVHPDFTLLNIKERKELYWEHFGMMDDIEYRNNAFIKIRGYESSGLYQHDSLIWTFETSSHPLNTKDIRKMIAKLKNTLGY